MHIDRRTFIAANLAFAARIVAAADRLVALSEWMRASRSERRAALQPLLEHINKLEPDIQAWVQLRPQPSAGGGSLAEIPFAVKDIIETKGLATEYGSPVYKGRLGTEDAAIVGELRGRGAVMLGKSHTTGFAYRAPAPTRNPRNREHTPGGCSSGSAAAVAAGMMPFALGTQTGGSVLRPASYCGVAGFKASYGLLPLEGVLPLAPSLDTLGFFTHTASDMLAQLADAGTTIMAYEAARVHRERFKEFGDRLGPIADLTREGLAMPVDRYDAARRYAAECRKKVAELFKATPVILTPAAPGPAPRGLASTGDARLNRPWTTLGPPAINMPMPVGSELPLGLQLAAAHGEDARLLRAAVRVEELLRAKS